MASKRKWSNLTPENRNRAAAYAKREFGLSRKQVRDRYNRGTYSPFSRDPYKRIPTEYRGPQGQQVIRTPEGRVTVDWKAAALSNMTSQLGDYYKWNRAAVIGQLEHANTATLRAISMATEDELISIAHIQNPNEDVDLPHGLTIDDIGYRNDNGEWINIFWYH